MRPSSLPLLAFAAALLPQVGHAAFDGPFSLVDDLTPAGLYTVAHEVPALGNWSVSFFPAEGGGVSYVDTGPAPASVILGAETPRIDGFNESETILFVELPLGGHVSFTVSVCNTTEDNGAAAFEVYLSGVQLYSLTQPGTTPYSLGFDVESGETLEFRSTAISAGTASFASNRSTISDFVFEASAIPEPASFAALVGLAALGLAGRRRRAAA